MTKYYKSSQLEKPVVYVQEDGQWRGYAPRGVLQRSTGLIPQVILAQTVEISQSQAETLIRIMRAEAETTVTTELVRASATAQGSSSPPRSRRPGWLRYALGGAAAVIVLAVVVVWAIGGFAGAAGTPGPPTGASGALPTEAIATVGGRSISIQQFDQRVAGFEAQYTGQIPDKSTDPAGYKVFQQGVLDYMITYELVSQKAGELNVTVTDQDVQTQIDLILKDSFGGDQTKFADAFKQQGLTMDQFKQSYKESMQFQKVYEQVTKDVTNVTDSAIQAYYNKHTSDSYAGKSLDAVRDEITSTLVSDKKSEVWIAWIDQQKMTVGVTYADGWKPSTTTSTLAP